MRCSIWVEYSKVFLRSQLVKMLNWKLFVLLCVWLWLLDWSCAESHLRKSRNNSGHDVNVRMCVCAPPTHILHHHFFFFFCTGLPVMPLSSTKCHRGRHYQTAWTSFKGSHLTEVNKTHLMSQKNLVSRIFPRRNRPGKCQSEVFMMSLCCQN